MSFFARLADGKAAGRWTVTRRTEQLRKERAGALFGRAKKKVPGRAKDLMLALLRSAIGRKKKK